VSCEYLSTDPEFKYLHVSVRLITDHAISDAALLIQEQIDPSYYKAEMHCEHCRWCLYIAGLICWGFGFVTYGNSAVQIQSLPQARQECDKYLAAMTAGEHIPQTGENSNHTTGLLHVLLNVLLNCGDAAEYLVEESVRSLGRITGSRVLV